MDNVLKGESTRALTVMGENHSQADDPKDRPQRIQQSHSEQGGSPILNRIE